MFDVLKNHPDYTTIDDALHSKMPECIIHLITTYNVLPKNGLLKEIKKPKNAYNMCECVYYEANQIKNYRYQQNRYNSTQRYTQISLI